MLGDEPITVTVSTGYTAIDTSIVLQAGDGSKLPAPPFKLSWWNDTDYSCDCEDPYKEIILVNGISNDTLDPVVRGQLDTNASNKNIAGKVYKMMVVLSRPWNVKGIIYNTISNLVVDKFDTPVRPALGANEAIKLRDDMNLIEKGATYNPLTDTYTNPTVTPPDHKAMYGAASTDSERIDILAQHTGLK